MTQVATLPFTVQIVSPSNPYAGYTLGQCTRVYTGVRARQTTTPPTEPGFGIMSYSGGCYDSSSGTFFVFGGGHETNDNSVWRFNVNALTWSRDYAPDHTGYPNPPDTKANLYAQTNWSTYPGMWLDTGRPISRHTRYSAAYMPNVGKFVVSGGSLWGGAGLGVDIGYPADGQETWLYDISTGTWSWKGSTLLNSSYLRPVDAWYSSIRQKVVSTSPQNIGNRTAIVEYDASLNTWSNHWDGSDTLVLTPLPADNNFVLASLDETGDRFFALINSVSLGLRVLEYSIATKRWTERTTTSKPRAPVEGDTLIYSPSSGRLNYILGDGTAYWLDLGTNAWNSWTNRPTNCAQILGSRAYCPSRGVMFFIVKNTSSEGVDVWAAKY